MAFAGALGEVEAISSMGSASSDSSIFPLTRMSLVLRLGARSRSDRDRAWDEFFDIYSPVIFRMGRFRGLSESDAEEVVAAVMRNFAGAVRSGLVLQGRLRNYLRSITNRQIGREKRLRGRRLALSELAFEPADNGANLDDHWEHLERDERLRVCLERIRSSPAIRPRDWAAFEAWVLRGEPAKAVARRYGITPNRLYGIRHKIMQELRRMKTRLDVELGEV
jgi:RNA polymerase sigma-70 factor (ECF subfamily)